MLHHIAVAKIGAPELICGGLAERFYAEGEERQQLALPPGYGYPNRATGPVRVWRIEDQRLAFPPLAGHTGPVTGIAFDTAGSFLASATVLGATRLWDPATGLAYGDELASSPVPASLQATIDLPILGLRNAFSPDGQLLAVGGLESRAMLWDVDPAVWRQRACAIAGRNLSREEWELHLPPETPYRETCSQWPAG